SSRSLGRWPWRTPIPCLPYLFRCACDEVRQTAIADPRAVWARAAHRRRPCRPDNRAGLVDAWRSRSGWRSDTLELTILVEDQGATPENPDPTRRLDPLRRV